MQSLKTLWHIVFMATIAVLCLVAIGYPKQAVGGVMVLCLIGPVVTRDYLAPATLIGAFTSAIMLLGGLNFSIVRGTINEPTFRVVFYNIAALTASVAAFSFFLTTSANRRPNLFIPRAAVIVAALPGLVGLVMMVAATGTIPAIQPNARFEMGPKAAVLCGTLIVPFCLQGYRLLLMDYRPRVEWLLLVAIGIGVFLPGYRGWLVVPVLVFVMVATASGRIKVSPVTVGLTVVGLFGMLTAISVYRRSTMEGMLSSEAVMARYRIEGLPAPLVQMHIYLRDSVYLTQQLVNARFNSTIGRDLLFSDLRSMLPGGGDQSGGQALGQMFGSLNLGGLTPGATGAIYLLAGGYSFLVFAALGAMIGWLWKNFRKNGSIFTGMLASIMTVYTVHWFVRGIISINYVLIPAYFAAVILGYYMLARLYGWRWTTEPDVQAPLIPGRRRPRRGAAMRGELRQPGTRRNV